MEDGVTNFHLSTVLAELTLSFITYIVLNQNYYVDNFANAPDWYLQTELISIQQTKQKLLHSS